MIKLRLLIKMLFNNKRLSIMTIVFFFLVILYTAYTTFQCNRYSLEPLFYLKGYLYLSVFSFLFFSFLSYEYLYCLKKWKTEELLKTTKTGIRSFYLYGFFSLSVLAGISMLMLLSVSIFVYFSLQINHSEYLIYLIYSNLFFFFFVPLIGILLGALLSLLNHRIISYFILIAIMFIISPAFEIIAYPVYTSFGINLYNFSELFNIFPNNLNWTPISVIAYPITQKTLCLALFWLFLILSLFLYLSQRNKLKSLLSFFTAVCFISYCQLPYSEVILNDNPQKGATADAQYYYNSDFISKEREADFSAEAYDMTFTMGRELTANVTIKLSQSASKEYFFTLYHGYKIISVTSNNKVLKFKQDSDYFTVDTNSEEIDLITIKYSGSSPKFFAGYEGCSLPGWFAYYPHPGFYRLFDTKTQSHNRLFTSSETEYSIKINSPQEIYCNLEKTDYNQFEGPAEGVTLVSGMYETVSIENIEIIYPYLASNAFNTAELNTFVKKASQEGITNNARNKIIIIADINLLGIYEMCSVFSDHITASSLNNILTFTPIQNILPQKQTLYAAFELFCSQPDLFYTLADSRKNDNLELGLPLDEDIYVLLADKIDKLGEEYIKTVTENYLYDQNDVRNSFEFLKQCGGK